MGSLWPLQELPGPGLHGKNVIAKKKYFFHIVTTYEKLVVNYFSLLYICLHLDEVCIFWDFGTPGFGVRPPNYKQNYQSSATA